MYSQLEIVFPTQGLPDLSREDLLLIRTAINRKWKGMASRATYNDMNQAIGVALRGLNLSDDDKRDFAIKVAGSLHYPRPTCRDMSVDHICRIAGVPDSKIQMHRRVR